ncbi:methylornithine synthase PylB [Methanonatronarchaeum sp. AMET-Sl]|uniref:methylornithine synthase PylB n=1 Tax=Methanonatronarchaeum sp. AMET-Sl TaxID=3037654 RepID=UPI00244DA002|nr:methylornithine synthase PylB [Methanonatronarchaeum sp. AMET-Sl]WGI16929.1 methylornithine synthase PylB [Methanonatronarchaeum sp. AMET-Sl]
MTSSELKTQTTENFETALTNTLNNEYTVEDLMRLLKPQDKKEEKKLYREARKLRQKNFPNGIYLYGFVYFSTNCRNNCRFCYYRKNNKHSERYRKTKKEITKISKKFIEEGVHLLDLTSGEDPYYHNEFNRFTDIINEIKKLNTPTMISPGVLTPKQIKKAREAGADWYALYQETHSKELYQKLRPNQPYKQRYNARKNAQKHGLLTEDGMLLGIGENLKNIAKTIKEMSKQQTSQVRCMKYVKQKGIPIPPQKPPTKYSTVTAVLRLTNPNKLIPASLDINGLKGIQKPLKAGANVVTSLVISDSGLKGVAQHEYGINTGERSPKNVIKYLKQNNYKINTKNNLKKYIKQNKNRNRNKER